MALQSRVDSIASIYTTTIHPCDILGFEELDAASITLYPNPASSILNISGISMQAKITIYDSFGRLVIEISNENSINVEHLTSGMYIVHVEDNGAKITKRFIK